MIRVEIIANHSVEDNILEALAAENAAKFYTRFPGVYGVGRQGPRMGDAIWPEENFVLVVWCEADEAAAIERAIKAVKRQFPNEGIKLFGMRDAAALQLPAPSFGGAAGAGATAGFDGGAGLGSGAAPAGSAGPIGGAGPVGGARFEGGAGPVSGGGRAAAGSATPVGNAAPVGGAGFEGGAASVGGTAPLSGAALERDAGNPFAGSTAGAGSAGGPVITPASAADSMVEAPPAKSAEAPPPPPASGSPDFGGERF